MSLSKQGAVAAAVILGLLVLLVLPGLQCSSEFHYVKISMVVCHVEMMIHKTTLTYGPSTVKCAAWCSQQLDECAGFTFNSSHCTNFANEPTVVTLLKSCKTDGKQDFYKRVFDNATTGGAALIYLREVNPPRPPSNPSGFVVFPYADADAACKKLHMRMAELTGSQVFARAKRIATGTNYGLWVGGKCSAGPDTCTWLTSRKPIDPTYWRSREPSSQSSRSKTNTVLLGNEPNSGLATISPTDQVEGAICDMELVSGLH